MATALGKNIHVAALYLDHLCKIDMGRNTSIPIKKRLKGA
jgi:hypothetical protein